MLAVGRRLKPRFSARDAIQNRMVARLLSALLLLVAILAPPLLTASDWSIDLVPSRTEDPKKQSIILYQPIYVVLTNTSGRTQVMWNEWCSWGYYNLSFQFKSADGKVIQVRKSPIYFTKNYSDPFFVPAGHHFVLAATFRNSEQTNRYDWLNTDGLDGVMTVKAIYKNTNEPFPGHSAQNKEPDNWRKLIDSAWIGEVQSEPKKFEIIR
jgi:hypothetical protein